MARLGFLDTLRGLAALYVVIYHMALTPAFKPEVPHAVYGFVMLGGSGVMLFFVLSAFSLCLTAPRHYAHPYPLLSFYVSRLFRIGPLFLVAIVFYIWRDGYLFGISHSAWEIALSASMLFNLSPANQHSIVWAGWTIGVEVLFYLAFPLVLTVCRDLASRVAGLFISSSVYLIINALYPEVIGPLSVLRFLPVFFLGMIAFSIYDRAHQRAGRSIGASLVGAGVLGLTYMVTAHPVTLPFFVGDVWQGGFWACILLGSGFSGALSWVSTRVSKTFGALSFGIYLAHFPIIQALSPAYEGIYGAVNIVEVAFLLCTGLTVAAIVPVAWGLHLMVEAPGMAAARAILNRPAERQASAKPFREALTSQPATPQSPAKQAAHSGAPNACGPS